MLTRPRSADDLFETVSAAAQSGEAADLMRVEEDVEEFLTRFANDQRATQVARFQDEIEISRLERRAQHGVSHQLEPDVPLAIQQLYQSAMAYAESDPARASEMLSAILVVWDADDLSGRTDVEAEVDGNAGVRSPREQYFALIRRKRDAILEKSVDRSNTQIREATRRLDFADRIAADNPARALQIYSGVVALYETRRWAAPLVNSANGGIKRLQMLGTTSVERNLDGP